MNPVENASNRLGNEPPLVAGGRKGPPDRREISARWLTGTFLTGFTSIILMGVALSAALDGRQVLATPAEVMEAEEMASSSGGDANGKASRLAATQLSLKITDRRVMEVSTLTRVGDRDVVKTMPFGFVDMALAAGHTTKKNYPSFSATDIFDDGGDEGGGGIESGQIYGAKVESEVSLKTSPLDVANMIFDSSGSLTLEEVEEAVRISGAVLTDGDVQVASLHYIDPLRFGSSGADFEISNPLDVKIVQENVTVSAPSPDNSGAAGFAEEVLPLSEDVEPLKALKEAGYEGDNAKGMAEAIATLLNAKKLKAGWALRIGVETRGENNKIVRVSLYEGKEHLFTIAVDDREQYVPTEAPDSGEDIIASLDGGPRPVRVRGDLPSVYDGIYRAAFAYDLTPRMARQLIKMLASNVDFQSRLNPSDELKVFFSIAEGKDKPDEESDVLYVEARFGGNSQKYYRFRSEDGNVDYYDGDGRSAAQFLIRNPVPQGVFRSGFGMRRHPILGYVRLHAGADWAAPPGTPILAAGNGIVEKAGWSSGYGKQTVIRHANGYETSYSHQTNISAKVVPGARVRQGQVIGSVGSTGLSTGPHLHYELVVNGVKVDPMRTRLPSGKSLKGAELAAFKKERERIDDLLAKEAEPQKVASN